MGIQYLSVEYIYDERESTDWNGSSHFECDLSHQ